MSLPLHFPNPNDTPGITDKHEQNGVTYYWDPVSLSWVLITSQSVNKDYVDSRDRLNYRRDGNDFIWGDVHVKENNSVTSQTNVKLKTDGTIITAGEGHLIFSPENSNAGDGGGRISVGNETGTGPLTLFFMTTAGTRHTKPFTMLSSDTNVHCNITNEGVPEVILFDITNDGPESSRNDAVIYLDTRGDSNFVVKGSGNTDNVKVTSTSSLTVTHSDEGSFVVTNKSSVKDPPFVVNAVDHKIFASTEYDEALRSRNQGGVVTGPEGETFHSYHEDNLLATKGYVDDRVGGAPGRTVCADREEDAEIGGFWWDGRGLFLRVG